MFVEETTKDIAENASAAGQVLVQNHHTPKHPIALQKGTLCGASTFPLTLFLKTTPITLKGRVLWITDLTNKAFEHCTGRTRRFGPFSIFLVSAHAPGMVR